MTEKISSDVSPKIKKILIIAVAAVALLAAIIIIISIISRGNPANSSILVYKKNGASIVRIDDKEITINDPTADSFNCDEKNKRVFYVVDSSYSDGCYDLCYVQKKRGEISQPKIADYAVDKYYDISDNKVYYMKFAPTDNAYEGCICDFKNGSVTSFGTNIDSFYVLSDDCLYFTKMHADMKVLYSYDNGTASEVVRNIRYIYSYKNCDEPHILYETSKDSTLGDLYIAKSEGSPELICSDVSYVMYDHYKPCGNLYFFTGEKEDLSWSYVIADPYVETDKDIVKPNRNDYKTDYNKGLIGEIADYLFGDLTNKYTYSEEFNKANAAYQDKLVRDEIRTALNESMENGEFSVPIFVAFAYNESGTHKIAENIDYQHVYSVSEYGVPMIIYESTEVKPSASDMDTLVTISNRSKLDDVIDYAKSVVASSVVSKGMTFAAFSENGGVNTQLDEYNKSNTLFSFAEDGSRIYAFVRDGQGETLNLYTNTISDNLVPSKGVNIDTRVTGYRFKDNSVLYLKLDNGKNSGDVYSYDGKTEKLANSANSFVLESDDKVVIIKNYDPSLSEPKGDIYIDSDSEKNLIAQNVIVDSFTYTDKGKAAYICDDNGKTTLYIFEKGKSEDVCDSVSEIKLFR